MVSLLDKLSKPLLVGGLAIMSYLPFQQNVTAQDFGGLAEKIAKTEKEEVIEIPESYYIKKGDWYFFKTPIVKREITLSDGGPYSNSTYIIDIFASINGRLFIPDIPVVNACYDALECAKVNVGINPNNDTPEIILTIKEENKKDNKLYGNLQVLADKPFVELTIHKDTSLYLQIFEDSYTFKKELMKKSLKFTRTNVGGIFGSQIHLNLPIEPWCPILIHSKENLKECLDSFGNAIEEEKNRILKEKHKKWVSVGNAKNNETFVWFYYFPEEHIIEKIFE